MLDTNVFTSFLISSSNSPITTILKDWKRGNFVVLLSKPIVTEVTKVFTRSKISQAANMTQKDIKEFLGSIIDRSVILNTHSEFNIVKNDPTDNKFLNLAVDGQAKYIVSGDKHLLDLGKFKKIKILQPSKFAKKLPVSSHS